MNPNADKPKLDLPDAAHHTGERAKELREELREDYAARSEMDKMIDEVARMPVRDQGKDKGPER